ncbi:hypothetical protein BaRGS_00003561 [Batillaria attramentaria]|uniref:Uncharacterized protein n=1 Tax=Batillaria attramentaria TaxID=370345 RepID=A0ABD0M0F2_9CAEN
MLKATSETVFADDQLGLDWYRREGVQDRFAHSLPVLLAKKGQTTVQLTMSVDNFSFIRGSDFCFIRRFGPGTVK